MAELNIKAAPGTEPWVLNEDDAEKISTWMRNDVTLEYWPRSKIQEIWKRDMHTADDETRQDTNFRGYSFGTTDRGYVAVIFVDEIESYPSATFVVLHELAHLHAPPWSPPVNLTDAQVIEEEERADEVANRLMSTLLGYPEGPYEVRLRNPDRPCCPRHMLFRNMNPPCVGKADLRDAYEVLRDMLTYEKQFQFFRLPDPEELVAQRCNVQALPVNKIKTWGDYGRRPKGRLAEKPIIVAKVKNRFIVLDGQHRVLVAQERGRKTISGIVIPLKER